MKPSGEFSNLKDIFRKRAATLPRTAEFEFIAEQEKKLSAQIQEERERRSAFFNSLTEQQRIQFEKMNNEEEKKRAGETSEETYLRHQKESALMNKALQMWDNGEFPDYISPRDLYYIVHGHDIGPIWD